ncbi:hypothetical protein PC129_g18790 [Phytophthora cactorum]|uniref:Uncharacterized protein n=1 Tax=Phytophthora cactorum TaxID=29920 RepID=A0A329RPL6_9STRA|nr:hypothetical protein GQ600_16488 [Phytophthora cactorum]KAG2761499.1 hypothetical protein Pcac1_g26707 [Phytophthora cactorum]KAG2793138.1 hypothetical protein PC111_g23156 [Phytophthora cactorum]KAG2793455.1 hypothetical protein PC112_g23437 [Phytophthora cactorum]KAG2814482.1 hypothetical protein PC113_g23310 [Phytophthora cactorum]
MSKMHVGTRVRGKTKKLRGKVGVIKIVRQEFRQLWYDVQWSTGDVETVAGRSIETADSTARADQMPDDEPEAIGDPAYSTFTELLRASNAVCIGDIESSSLSDDEAIDEFVADTSE